MLDTLQAFVDTSSKPLLLVVDPKPLPNSLQNFFDSNFTIATAQTFGQALQLLSAHQPAVVCISTRFAPTKIVSLLESIKECSQSHLIPVLFVLDLSQPTIVLPGTRWAGKLGIVTQDMTDAELTALFDRLLKVHPDNSIS
jgi:hypothetical protein